MRKLNEKQKIFCTKYIETLNATQAAIAAGYAENSARITGSRLLTNDNIQAYIQESNQRRLEAVEMDADYVLRRLKQIDELDVLDIMQDDMSGFKSLKEWPKAWRTSLSAIDIVEMIKLDEDGEPFQQVIKKVKWPDKVKNLEMIGRHIKVGAWKEEKQAPITLNNIMPVPTASSVEEWEKAAKEVHEQTLNQT